jgi:hypothetical protein
VLAHPFIAQAELEPPRGPEESMVVDLGLTPTPVEHDGAQILELPGGSIEVDFGGPESVVPAGAGALYEHAQNLAEGIAESESNRIAQEVCDAVTADLESRKEWKQRIADGLEILGIREPTTDLGVFAIAKKINHPVVAEAAVQFQARAIAELIPSAGPAKGVVMGERTKQLEEQAMRVEGYQNWQLMVDDKGFFPDFDQMLFMLGLEGSEFRKAFRDPIEERNKTRWVRAEDFVVPYSATSLETAPRYTEIIHESQNDVRKKQAVGFYRDVELGAPATADAEAGDELRQTNEALDGNTGSGQRPEDAEHTIYECHIDLVVVGDEDCNEDGEPTGIARPYIATVDKDTQTLLALRRNWRETDLRKLRRQWYTHYKYLPGTGFYGFGLLHLIGGLGNAATGVLRAILVTGALAGAGGGFKTKDAKIPGSVMIEPGVYKDIDHTYDELQKAFWQPDFKEPPQALFNVLGHLVDATQRFATTNEALVGDAPNTGPVGTTVALIEQGSKVFSAVHKRCHYALGIELQILAELNGEHIPEEGYPYTVPGESRQIFRTDFDDRVDVVPVSDPNIYSTTQRVAIAQARLDLANQAPDLFDRRAAFKNMLVALRDPDVEGAMVDHTKINRCDPVTENALALVGIPIRVFVDQEDEAHLQVHGAWMQQAQAKGAATPQALAVMQAHMAEHYASHWRKTMAAMIGMPLGEMNLQAKPGEPVVPQLPPQLENEIAKRAAQALAQKQQQSEANAPKDPKAIEAEAKAATIARESEERMQREKAEAQHKADVREAAAKHDADLKRWQAEQEEQRRRWQEEQQRTADAKRRDLEALGGDTAQLEKAGALHSQLLAGQQAVVEATRQQQAEQARALEVIAQAVRTMAEMQKMMHASMQAMVQASMVPRETELIFDDKGNPIGSRSKPAQRG